MGIKRYEWSEEQWQLTAQLLSGKIGDCGSRGADIGEVANDGATAFD